MQKYKYHAQQPYDGDVILPSCADGAEFYLASEADARIEQLERALDSCQLVLALELKEREKFRTAAEAAYAEAAKALALSPPF